MIKRPCPHCGYGLADRRRDFDGLREYECQRCCWTWHTAEVDAAELRTLRLTAELGDVVAYRIPHLGRIGDGKWFHKKGEEA